jgi:plasmid stabilization system protein ParE
MRVIWTQRALNSYFKVADYLQEKWGERVVNDFTTKVQKVIEQIKEMPNMFEVSKKYKNVRKGFVTEHNTLYYRVKERKKEIELLIFWDNRQEPKKLKY